MIGRDPDMSAPSNGLEREPDPSEGELLARLHQEAEQRMGNIGGPRSFRKSAFAILVISIVILGVAFGAYRYHTARHALAEVNSARNSAPDTVQIATNTPIALPTVQRVLSPTPTLSPWELDPQHNPRILFMPYIAAKSQLCTETTAVKIKIVSGPRLSPEPGTTFMEGDLQNVQASWVIRNIGECSLTRLGFWSIEKGLLIPALIRTGDRLLDPEQTAYLLLPGEQVELILEFDPQEAEKVEAEWVLHANNLFLFPAPHPTLIIDQWITYQARPTRVATPRYVQPPQPGGQIRYPTSVVQPTSPPAVTPSPPATRP